MKWIEDRLEHLSASVSATNRVTHAGGRGRWPTAASRALAWDQIEDVGAHIRAPEPATLYRMHGNLTGAYDIRHVSVRNRVVLTNKTPTGLNRGFGGPQVYYALERLMQRIAVELEARSARCDPPKSRAVRRVSLLAPRPVPCSIPATTRSAFETALADGGFAELRERQTQARAQGRIYGIGLTAVVEPSVSNMGYITTVLTPEERRKAGPKNGAQATATVALDPLRRRVGACRLGAAGPGPSHRAGADRRRCARTEAFRHSRRHRARHRARRLVDRLRQLFQPLRRRRRRRRPSRRTES